MKFKCIEVECKTSRFTVGKVYDTDNDRFIINDKGVLCFMSYALEIMIGIGDKKLDKQKVTLNDWPLFAKFEDVSD
jgi:hypothetical protein